MLNPKSPRGGFRLARAAFTGAMLSIAALGFGSQAFGQTVGAGPTAPASTVLTGPKCIAAQGAALATLREFEGKLSQPMAESIATFGKTCDLNTDFQRVPGTADDRAWERLRVRMSVIRTSNLNWPPELAKR